jgi:hypothetical protein
MVNGPSLWLLPDLLVNGYTSIMLIRLKWYNNRGHEITEQSMYMSRKILKAFKHLLDADARIRSITLKSVWSLSCPKLGGPGLKFSSFTAQCLFLAFFTLFTKVLKECNRPQSRDTIMHSEDLQMMLSITSSTKVTTAKRTGFYAAIEAFKILVNALQFILNRS